MLNNDNLELAKILFLQGCEKYEEKKFSEAETFFSESLKIIPNRISALRNLGATLTNLKRFDEAKLILDKVLKLEPNDPAAMTYMGNIFQYLGEHLEAITKYRKVIAIDSNNYEAWNNLGVSLHKIDELDDAHFSFNKCIEIDKSNEIAWLNKSYLYECQTSRDKSLECLHEALENCQDKTKVEVRLAQFFIENNDYKRGKELLSDKKNKFSNNLATSLLLYCNLMHCDWADQKELKEHILENKSDPLPPFISLCLTDSSLEQLNIACAYSDFNYFKEKSNFLKKNKKRSKEKIKLAYYSCDFYNHATAHLISEIFELHNRDNFNLIAFNYGPTSEDIFASRIKSSFEEFYQVDNFTDEKIVTLSRQIGIDIAVDLKGHTQNGRMGIFARRAAPIQISYLGYPGTTGANFIDFIIADEFVIPSSLEHHYIEKVLKLPVCFQANDRKRSKGTGILKSREYYGLKDNSFVFACFNNNYKFNPEIINLWVTILNGVKGSVLWLLKNLPAVKDNLINEFVSRGIDSNRLIFAERLPFDQHLDRYYYVDLFLDTYPIGAHTTASESIWMGVPILTIIGEVFSSRVCGSLLNHASLNELICTNKEEYVHKAILFGNDKLYLNSVKSKLIKESAKIFNTDSFIKEYESVLIKIYQDCV